MSRNPDSLSSLVAGDLFVRAPAKVNLYLEVLGRRENGYHDIRSIVVPVSLFDEIWLKKADSGTSIEVDGNGTVGGEQLLSLETGQNLAARAAEILRQNTGYAGGVRIHLRKHIPVGGGLGGGSADAAAVLWGLNRLWDLGLDSDSLAQMGSRLGCDIPSLVHGGPVCMEGLGERVRPLVLKESGRSGWWLVLANPLFSVSTGDIYSRYRKSLTPSPETLDSVVAAVQEGDPVAGARNLFNALERTVVEKYPLIGVLLEKLEKSGALASMVSGSGASVFGVASDRVHAEQIMQRLRESAGFPVWMSVVRTLPDGVMAAHGPLEARV